jgi:hypothetical protein
MVKSLTGSTIRSLRLQCSPRPAPRRAYVAPDPRAVLHNRAPCCGALRPIEGDLGPLKWQVRISDINTIDFLHPFSEPDAEIRRPCAVSANAFLGSGLSNHTRAMSTTVECVSIGCLLVDQVSRVTFQCLWASSKSERRAPMVSSAKSRAACSFPATIGNAPVENGHCLTSPLGNQVPSFRAPVPSPASSRLGPGIPPSRGSPQSETEKPKNLAETQAEGETATAESRAGPR